MIIDIALIVMMVITGIIGGIIVGALYMVLNVMWCMRKAKRDYKQGKRLFEIKETPKKDEQKKQTKKDKAKVPKETEPKALKVPKPETEPEERNYKKDFKRFKKANKKLEKAKKKYEKGKITHQELKEIFETYQNQDYYKRILKEYGRKK